LAFLAIFVEHAAVWGVLAFLLDFIPCIDDLQPIGDLPGT